MVSPWQYVLTVGPLALYLWVLALWQSGRQPRVVRGLADFAMLAFGVGGVLAFGPFGLLLTSMLFTKPDLLDQMVVVSGLGLCASLLARRALPRLVVYHTSASDLMQALAEILTESGGRFVQTLNGFEDLTSPRGLKVDFTRWLRCAVIEAYGRDPEGFIQRLRPKLKQKLLACRSPRSRVALVLYAGSVLVMFLPIAGMFLSQQTTREALRVLLRRLGGVEHP